jgi:16S rRNA (cytosine1402-N4)-methyltransferase
VHVPVLLSEILEALAPRSGGVYLDGTLGAGGYAEALLNASAPEGRVVGLDLDAYAVTAVTERLGSYGSRFTALHAGFHEAGTALGSIGIERVDGAVIDLGLSSDQLADPSRGLSFMADGPLDMRFDMSRGETARDLLRRVSVKQLEEILATYGEERYCKKLARAMIQARDRDLLKTTGDLASLVGRVLGKRRGKINPATRTFQALRIAVNRELDHLETALDEIPTLLNPGGRFLVVAYHSLEDRAVKHSFADRKRNPEKWALVTRRPLRPTEQEIRANPRARSARLRVLEAVAR